MWPVPIFLVYHTRNPYTSFSTPYNVWLGEHIVWIEMKNISTAFKPPNYAILIIAQLLIRFNLQVMASKAPSKIRISKTVTMLTNH